MSIAVSALVLVACRNNAAPSDPPKQAPADATAVVEVRLPPDFPRAGAAPVGGTLAARKFTLGKALLRKRADGTSLELYNWAAGGPCEAQHATEPDQLYVTAAFATARFEAGKPIASTDEHVFVIYKRPGADPIEEASWTVFDQITSDRAKGRMLVTAPDGTRIAGSFDASLCASPQQPVADGPAPIHGMAWGTRDVAPAAIPNLPVSGRLLGKIALPVAIEVVDWAGSDFEQHEVHFFTTAPPLPCAFTQHTPGFVIDFGKPLQAGLTATTGARAKHPPSAIAMWAEPGDAVATARAGWFTAAIDEVGKDIVKGRVFAWFDDASRSMLAGAFTAKNCNIKP